MEMGGKCMRAMVLSVISEIGVEGKAPKTNLPLTAEPLKLMDLPIPELQPNRPHR